MKEYLSNHFNTENSVNIEDDLPLWSAPFGMKLLDNIDYQAGVSALDIGFGSGFPLIELLYGSTHAGLTHDVYKNGRYVLIECFTVCLVCFVSDSDEALNLSDFYTSETL